MFCRHDAKEIADACLVMRARRISRALTRIYDDALRPHGLVAAQLNLLVAVGAAGRTRATDLGELLDIEKSTLSRTLSKMEDAGFIERDEARAYRLTTMGEEKLEAARPAWRLAQEEGSRLLGPELSRVIADIPASPA